MTTSVARRYDARRAAGERRSTLGPSTPGDAPGDAPRGVAGATCLLVVALLSLPGCGGDPRPSPSRDDPRAGSAAGGAADSAGAVASEPAGADDRPLRRYQLRMLNGTGEAVHVLAAAGRGEVVLDTVSPADSGDVWVETRASRLQLRAATAAGRTVRLDTLELREGEVNRWRLSPPSGP